MLAQFLALVITNSNFNLNAHDIKGFCGWSFSASDQATEYSDVVVVIRPQFTPGKTASGKVGLSDLVFKFGAVGRKRSVVTLNTDCWATGFDVISATSVKDGQTIDLIAAGKVQGKKGYMPVTVNGK
jgi:hypothetical protein